MTVGGSPQPIELWHNFGLREETLLRGFLHLFLVRSSKHNLVVSIVLIKQSTLVMDGAGRHLHLQRVLLCCLLDLLQMLIVAVFRQPRYDIAVGPVDLKSVRVLVVDMVLKGTSQINYNLDER